MDILTKKRILLLLALIVALSPSCTFSSRARNDRRERPLQEAVTTKEARQNKLTSFRACDLVQACKRKRRCVPSSRSTAR